MSEADNQAISTLLPLSTVAVFSKDQNTLQAARDIEQDWRFARVTLQVEEGDVSSAIEAYKETASPALVIIQSETIDDGLTESLGQLAEHCDEGTAAIIIGPDNDVTLYRKLIDMGISDYVVKPVETKVISDIIAKTLIDKIGVAGSRLIAFLGAKGGVGASALAQASAWGCAEIIGQKTIIVDASGGWSTLGVGMGFEPSTTLTEAVRVAANNDEDGIKRMLFDASDKLSVLASGGDVMLEPTVNSEQIEMLIDMLMVKYPVVIVDLSHAPAELEKVVVSRAHQVIVVATPTLPALRQARSLIQEVRDVRGGEDDGIEMIVNMQGLAPANEVPKGDIEAAMEFPVSATVAFAANVFYGSESEGKKLTDVKEGAQIVKAALLPILTKVIDANLPDDENANQKGGIMDGLLSKLKKK